VLFDSREAFGNGALLGWCFRLGGFALVLQLSLFGGVSFDPFTLKEDGLAATEVDVGRCQVCRLAGQKLLLPVGGGDT